MDIQLPVVQPIQAQNSGTRPEQQHSNVLNDIGQDSISISRSTSTDSLPDYDNVPPEPPQYQSTETVASSTNSTSNSKASKLSTKERFSKGWGILKDPMKPFKEKALRARENPAPTIPEDNSGLRTIAQNLQQRFGQLQTTLTDKPLLEDTKTHAQEIATALTDWNTLHEAPKNYVDTVSNSLENPKLQVRLEHYATNSYQALSDLTKDSIQQARIAHLTVQHNPEIQRDLETTTSEKSPYVEKTLDSPEFKNADKITQQAMLLSHSGVGTGKIFQILATNDSLPENIRKIFSETKSNCAPTRTLEEAQKEVNQLDWKHESTPHGDTSYTLTKRAGVATIGEVYFATEKTANGEKPVVIKMLKKGITEESLRREQRLAEDLIRSIYPHTQDQEFELNKLKNLYQGWTEELNFQTEANNAKALAAGAESFKVALPRAVATEPGFLHPTAMVQHVAPGFSMEQLSKMIELYKENPQKYQTGYSTKIKEHPWLANPNEWMHEIPNLYRNAFNEQTLIRIHNGQMVSHGDPHEGNVFISKNLETGKMEIHFIDAGMVSIRDAKTAIKHGGLTINSMIGHTNSLAEKLVDSASPKLTGKHRKEVIRSISRSLKKDLYTGEHCIVDANYFSQKMNHLMKQHGLFIPEAETVFMKSNMQAISVYKKWCVLVGQHTAGYSVDSRPDVKTGLNSLRKAEPKLFRQEALSNVKHVTLNPTKAMSCWYQYALPRMIKV
jgi:predicted unusual protein kinase regulating ubiquinone biosynthesis (AarF/ABC1/UbiB family)